MDADSYQPADDDATIAEYLARIRKAARHLPSGRRDWVIARTGDRLADALEPGGGDSQAVAAAVARLGDPAALVRAIDGHVPGAEARWMEFAAVLLVLAGGVLWRPAWLVGVTLLWVSARWRWPDKLLATLVWPGGLLAASLLATRYTALELFAGGFSGLRLPGGAFMLGRGNAGPNANPVSGAPVREGGSFFVRPHSSFRYLIDSTLGHPPLRHLLVLVVAAVPPVVVAIRLLRRARRPEQPDALAARVSAATDPGAGTGPS